LGFKRRKVEIKRNIWIKGGRTGIKRKMEIKRGKTWIKREELGVKQEKNWD